MAEQTVRIQNAPFGTVLAGSVMDDSAVITIPAGKTWYGFITLSAALGGIAQTSSVTINTTAATSVPAPSVNLVALTLTTGATDTGKNDVISTPYFYISAPAGASTDIDVSIDGAAIVAVTAYGHIII